VKAIAQRRETATADALLDRVLCHDVRDAGGKVAAPKGARIDGALAQTLLGIPWEEIHLLALDPGDVHEEDAGRRLRRLPCRRPRDAAAARHRPGAQHRDQ